MYGLINLMSTSVRMFLRRSAGVRPTRKVTYGATENTRLALLLQQHDNVGCLPTLPRQTGQHAPEIDSRTNGSSMRFFLPE